LLALWATPPRQLGVPRLVDMPALLRFGLPTVPADASVFALNVIDRSWLIHAKGVEAASVFSASVKIATGVIVVVRGFQAAWPPLAYSIVDDDQARRFYAVVTSAYVGVTGLAVVAMTLFGRWFVDLLTAPEFKGAYEALPWLALGWALYGLYLVFVVIAGRVRVMTRNFPAAIAGLAVNVLLLALLIDPLGIRGAGIALCGAYAVMLVVIHWLTRGLFHVHFEWWRLSRIVAVYVLVGVGGELLLPTSGVGGFVLRALALLATVPLLLAIGAATRGELAWLRERMRMLRPRLG
jgi:O-antigen/teichoic acid export membrane protein